MIHPLKPCSVACPGWRLQAGHAEPCPLCWRGEVLSPDPSYYVLLPKGAPVPLRTRQGLIQASIVSACKSTYGKLPPLPSQWRLRGMLSQLNADLVDGGIPASLYCQDAGEPGQRWRADDQNDGPGNRWPGPEHSEEIPGDGKPFDAMAASRRLLYEARQAGFK